MLMDCVRGSGELQCAAMSMLGAGGTGWVPGVSAAGPLGAEATRGEPPVAQTLGTGALRCSIPQHCQGLLPWDGT